MYNLIIEDLFRFCNAQNFSTIDQDNDSHINGDCTQANGGGGWWYGYCHGAFLNGEYGNNNMHQGINWQT